MNLRTLKRRTMRRQRAWIAHSDRWWVHLSKAKLIGYDMAVGQSVSFTVRYASPATEALIAAGQPIMADGTAADPEKFGVMAVEAREQLQTAAFEFTIDMTGRPPSTVLINPKPGEINSPSPPASP